MSVTKEELEYHQRLYSQGKAQLSDADYDQMVEDYIEEHGGDESFRPFARNRQTDDVNQLVGTLPKCYNVRNAMREGQITYEMFVNKRHWESGNVVCIQPKFDGCSVAYDFETHRFFTRGDFDNGESVDVTDVFSYHEGILWNFATPTTKAMKFEAILSQEIYMDEKYGIYLKYKRPRDFVAATITSRNKEFAKLITLIPLRGIDSNGEYIPVTFMHALMSTVSASYTLIEDYIKDILSTDTRRPFFNQHYAVDGVVVSCINATKEDRYAYTDPDNEVAIKIIFDAKKTRLKNIEYTVGKQGRITPVAILEPVKFGNVTVDHVTLSTLDRVASLNLRYNDTVNVMYNIVPYLIDSEGDGDLPVKIPDTCPICGNKLTYITLKQVTCTNPSCRSRILGGIIRHAQKMRMMGVSEGIITRLYDEGLIKSIPDLYRLRDYEDIIKDMDGFGDKSYWNIVNSINNALHEATLERFLGSLPINDTDEGTWKQVILVMSSSTVIESLVDKSFISKLMSVGYIPNVGQLKIKKIADGVLQHEDMISELMKWVPYQLKQTSRGNEYKGKVAMSGTRDKATTEALQYEGYDVGSFTKDCKALIIPTKDFTSDKVTKAKSWGIPVYTLDEAYEKLIKPF